MDAESSLLSTLVSGSRSAKDIPLPSSTRGLVARRLEARGLLKRKQVASNESIYELTSEGLRHAISRGFTPVVKPYFQEVEGETPEIIKLDQDRMPKRSYHWLVWAAFVLAASGILFSLTWQVMIWTHYIK